MALRIPDGYHTVTPRIVVHDAPGLVSFVKRVFNASGDVRLNAPSEICIGDSMLMISESGEREPMTAFLYVYVDDCDATYSRAIQAGATSLESPQILHYGDRRGMVEDPYGNIWQIASRPAEEEAV